MKQFFDTSRTQYEMLATHAAILTAPLSTVPPAPLDMSAFNESGARLYALMQALHAVDKEQASAEATLIAFEGEVARADAVREGEADFIRAMNALRDQILADPASRIPHAVLVPELDRLREFRATIGSHVPEGIVPITGPDAIATPFRLLALAAWARHTLARRLADPEVTSANIGTRLAAGAFFFATASTAFAGPRPDDEKLAPKATSGRCRGCGSALGFVWTKQASVIGMACAGPYCGPCLARNVCDTVEHASRTQRTATTGADILQRVPQGAAAVLHSLFPAAAH